MDVLEFKGDYRWLSNFHSCDIIMDINFKVLNMHIKPPNVLVMIMENGNNFNQDHHLK